VIRNRTDDKMFELTNITAFYNKMKTKINSNTVHTPTVFNFLPIM